MVAPHLLGRTPVGAARGVRASPSGGGNGTGDTQSNRIATNRRVRWLVTTNRRVRRLVTTNRRVR
eukprot:4209219-Pyramimonas_sp.AAC.1